MTKISEEECNEIITHINEKIDEINEQYEYIGKAKIYLKNIKKSETLTELQKKNNSEIIINNINDRKEIIWGKKNLLQNHLNDLKQCKIDKEEKLVDKKQIYKNIMDHLLDLRTRIIKETELPSELVDLLDVMREPEEEAMMVTLATPEYQLNIRWDELTKKWEISEPFFASNCDKYYWADRESEVTECYEDFMNSVSFLDEILMTSPSKFGTISKYEAMFEGLTDEQFKKLQRYISRKKLQQQVAKRKR